MPSSVTMPSVLAHPGEAHALHVIQSTLKLTFGIVPIVAGFDKFTNILVHWEQYLNPAFLGLLPFSAATFMYLVGVIEIIAGIVVLARPRLGAWIVMAWLIAIAFQLLIGWRYVDVAVRDLVMAIGALTLARLTYLNETYPGRGVPITSTSPT